MIARISFLSVVSFITVLGLSVPAWAAELTQEYLLGKWVIDEANCSDSSSEFVTFRNNGAVDGVRDGKLEASGFWGISDEIFVVHVVASPAFFHDYDEEAAVLKAHEGKYFAFRIRVVPFNMELNQFGAVGLLGEQVKKAVFSRC